MMIVRLDNQLAPGYRKETAAAGKGDLEGGIVLHWTAQTGVSNIWIRLPRG